MAHPDRHVLFRVSGVTLHNVAPDLMHCKHLGTDQYYYGSVLKLLTHHIMTGTRAENLDAVWGELCAAYTALGVRNRLFIGVTLNSCVGGGWSANRLGGFVCLSLSNKGLAC